MAKLMFDRDGCVGATSGLTGRSYDTDKSGFLNVQDPKDLAFLKKNGYSEAGGMPRVKKWWHCEPCNWDSNLNHCRYCDSTDLTRMESDR